MPHREHELLYGISVTARPFSHIEQYIDFSHTKTALDVAAGCSDTTAKLVTMGVDAFAVDPRYGRYFDIEARCLSDLEQWQSMDRDIPEDMSFGKQIKAMFVFSASRKQEPHRYRAGSATSLPFADGTFDNVFSAHGISEHLSGDLELLSASIDEALRVTTDGGRIQIYPWHEQVFDGNGGSRNQAAVEQMLQERGLTVQKRKSVIGRQATLVIFI